MNIKSTPKLVKLKNLILDKDNPRFAELYSGSDKEEDLINYLLYNESAEDVAKSIFEADEFYPDRPLWVLEDGKNFLVKDGNRRCASVKALNHPLKYGLDVAFKMNIKELPVLVYKDKSDLDERIRQEHTSSLFKQWGRIAKAIEVFRLYKTGTSIESMRDFDSSPNELIKLASFYYEAVKLSSEDFKKLLRSGKGKSGGKTIVFERLFKYRKECGYTFKRDFEIDIKDKTYFESYIKSMVAYLKDNPETSSRTIDRMKGEFLKELKPYGFPPVSSTNPSTGGTSTSSASTTTSGSSSQSNSGAASSNDGKASPIPSSSTPSSGTSSTSNPSTSNPSTSNSGRKSVKHKPIYTRKKIPAPLENLIKECYNLDQNNFPNAKTAMSRITFECTLKFIVENTDKGNGKALKTSNHFQDVYFKKGKPTLYTDFDKLKSKFTELIKDTGTKKAFEDFNLQNSHQIIHNYHVRAVPANAKGLCDNLIVLIEFMLQEESDLLQSLDQSKI
ncbi:hypothetical protein SAMN04487764_0904 [Gillisia sp. Hel1_33_143]|uniref:hypothetical protein n=1 Tax=Gillisia sp. Hel1_33_143 TaxID=1336796 RepID=UPI00087A3544|nr:hypothetical protein [Gillisia sp. Hel1_33_143]SDR87261.1 hypothetical protein SAMN04487764_0904 [Gillisia sp. Hel1_33_143]